jgi:hypothetical protein
VTVHDGHLYVADEDPGSVRMVNASGYLTTPAGTGAYGSAGNGGPAAKANRGTCGTAVDSHGNLVIADSEQYQIQVVAAKSGTFYGKPMIARHIYSVAGDGQRGVTGAGGVATQAKLSGPRNVIIDDGNLVFADSGFKDLHAHKGYGSRVQVVAARTGEFFGQPMTAGHIYTVAGMVTGTGNSGEGGPAIKAAIGEWIGTVRATSSSPQPETAGCRWFARRRVPSTARP